MRINCESHTGMGDEFHHYEIVHQVYARDDRLVHVTKIIILTKYEVKKKS